MINIIHQIAFSSEDLDGYVPPNKSNIEEFFPTAEYHFWDLPNFIKLLKEDGATDVLDAINGIKAYAYKSDIARYYLIYKMGGWYVDQNNYFQTTPAKARLTRKDLVVFSECQLTSAVPWGIQNSLFYADPKHTVMENSIKQCIENVKEQYYGFSVSCPTGPNVFGAAIAAQRLPDRHNQEYGHWYYWPEAGKPRGFYLPVNTAADPGSNPFPPDNEPFALWKPYATLKHPGGTSGIPGGNNYWDLWEDKKLY